MPLFDNSLPPGIRGYAAGQELGNRNQEAEIQRAHALVGILGQIKAQQEEQTVKGILASTSDPREAIPKLLQAGPTGAKYAGVLSKLQADQATQANAGILGSLRAGQLQEVQRKSAEAQTQTNARGALANLLSPGGSYGQGTDMERPNAQVFNNDAEAIAAMQAAEKAGQPFTGNVPNPSNVKALAVAAGNSLPRGTASALFGVGPNGQTIAPRLIQSAESPTGWGYLDPRTKEITPGAPAPASIARAEAAKVGDAGAGMMTPETLKFTAQQVLAGDRQAGQGYARSAPMRAALQNAIADEAKAQGISGKDLANIMAEYTGMQSGQRSLGTRQAQIEMAATVTKQFAPLAITASEAFDRSGLKSLNDVQKALQSRTASPELRQFNFANLSLINAYARAINPTGVGAQADKDHAREVLDTGFSKGDYKAAVDQLQKEINAELEAPGQVKQDMRKRFGTGAGVGIPTDAVTTPQPAAVIKNTSKSGRAIHSNDGGKTWEYD